MAWFFRHISCSKERAELRERIVTLETEQQGLKLAHKDLLERFLQYEGREKKRASRQAPVVNEEPATALPGERRAITPTAGLARRFKIGG